METEKKTKTLAAEFKKHLSEAQAQALLVIHQIGFTITNVFTRNLQSKYRVTVNKGGTGSSKTISLAQLFIILAHTETGQVYSVVRKTKASLTHTAERDFFDLLKQYSLYHEENHNMSDHIYTLHGNEIEFFGVDEPQRVRGRKRKLLWCNEMNELSWEDWHQLQIRTKGQIYGDFNPSDEQHWMYDKLFTQSDCQVIHSTYKDNPYLDQRIVSAIEALQTQDENYWTIYGLGEIGRRKEIIFSNWDLVDEVPDDVEETLYGLDFGFVTSPAALLEINIKGNEVWLDEKLYEQRLTNAQLCQRMDSQVRYPHAYIIADSAEPKSIEEISQYERESRSRYNILPCVKGADSVNHSIQTVKKYKLHVTKRSTNLISELQTYAWKRDRGGEIFVDSRGRPEPIKFKDHLISCLRYGLDTYEIEVMGRGTRILFDA
jgi:phage terminase large subunit